ncbi:ExeA family protein [Lautropia mirabilis]|jgi:general secretion pathway protein-related protein
MYKSFFGLKSKPFRLNPHLRFLFNSEAIQRAVNTLKYGLYQREGLVLLTGAPGCGKTMLVQNVSRRLPDAGIQVFTIATPRANGHSLLLQIFAALGLDVPADADTAQLLRTLQKYLLGEVQANRRLLLVIDEAHNLEDDALEVVRLLSDMQLNGNLLLQIFLVAQPVLRARLATPRLDALRQRFLVTDHIDGLTSEEVPQYIQKRMQQAGWQGDTPFDAEAIERIQQATDGNPRQVNILCERLLTQAYVEEKTRVTLTDVDNTLQDMEDEWRTSVTVADNPSASKSARLQDMERRMASLDASLDQISQVTNTILVRLDGLRQG